MKGVGLNSTPIGAMYASELFQYNSTEGQEARQGNPIGAYQNLPGYGYGPYSQAGAAGATSNMWDVYASDGLERIKSVYTTYFGLYQITNPSLFATDTALQFDGMDSTSGVINNNFEPLREYVYKIGTGLEYMFWTQPNLAINGNLAANSFMGWRECMVPSTQTTSGHADSAVTFASRGNNWWFTSLVGGGQNGYSYPQWNGMQKFRFYEPHWEYDTLNNRWQFRFAQPVIGLSGTQTFQNGNQQYSDSDMDNMELGERKYKFKNMLFKKSTSG